MKRSKYPSSITCKNFETHCGL